MEERSGESEESGFLPPEPAGPEPELGGRRAQAPPPPAPGHPPPPPPSGPHASGPVPVYGYPPPPPGYAYPQPWGYPQQPVPDNGPAVAGFVLSLVSGGLLVVSAGFSSIISVACAIAGIIYSRKGRQKVDAGETPKHRGLAQAGVIIGWVSLALSVLATIAWSLVLAFAIADDGGSGPSPDTVRAMAAAVIGG